MLGYTLTGTAKMSPQNPDVRMCSGYCYYSSQVKPGPIYSEANVKSEHRSAEDYGYNSEAHLFTLLENQTELHPESHFESREGDEVRLLVITCFNFDQLRGWLRPRSSPDPDGGFAKVQGPRKYRQ